MKDYFYKNIKNLGFKPKLIVDCGAAYGEWSLLIKSIYPDATVVGIDANDWTKDTIPGTDITEIAVLSDVRDKEVTFYRNKEHLEKNTFCTGDSIFKEISQHYQKHNTIEHVVKSNTLSSILDKHNLGNVDILKIDTQGSELIIMKGLGERLKNVQFIELECSIIEYNVGGCSFSEVVSYLSEHFNLFDIVNAHRISQSSFDINNKEIKQGDFLFQIDVIFKNKNFII